MRFVDAKKLHNEDEVIDKETGESIRVLSIKILPYGYGTQGRSGTAVVQIEGVGTQAGYKTWDHDQVR
jgi:hypothetical protein